MKWKAILTITAWVAEKPNLGCRRMARFMALVCIMMDQIISKFGRPDHVVYDIRSLRNKANPDDTFEAQLFYA